ncbi:hypothetical protein ABIE49_000811 [Bradyrhizobium sp. OAE829]
MDDVPPRFIRGNVGPSVRPPRTGAVSLEPKRPTIDSPLPVPSNSNREKTPTGLAAFASPAPGPFRPLIRQVAYVPMLRRRVPEKIRRRARNALSRRRPVTIWDLQSPADNYLHAACQHFMTWHAACVPMVRRRATPLRTLLLHRQLNLIGKGRKMQGQPIKQFPLCRVRSEVANQPTFSRVGPELF